MSEGGRGGGINSTQRSASETTGRQQPNRCGGGLIRCGNQRLCIPRVRLGRN